MIAATTGAHNNQRSLRSQYMAQERDSRRPIVASNSNGMQNERASEKIVILIGFLGHLPVSAAHHHPLDRRPTASTGTNTLDVQHNTADNVMSAHGSDCSLAIMNAPASDMEHRRGMSAVSQSPHFVPGHRSSTAGNSLSSSNAYPRSRGPTASRSGMLQPLILNAPMMGPAGLFDVVTPAMKTTRSDMLNAIAGDGGVPSPSKLLDPVNVPFEEPTRYCKDVEYGVVHIRNVSARDMRSSTGPRC